MSPFVSLYLAPVVSQPGRLPWLSGVEGFICLPLSPFICLPLSPSLDAWHGSLGGRVHLSPFVSLHLCPVASQPGCLARLSGWTGSFVSLCLPSFVWHGSLGFVSMDVWHGSPGRQIHLSPFVSLHLSPVVSQPGCLARLFGWTVSLVSLCLPSFGSPCLPACMSVTAPQADGFTCLPWFPFICLPSLWVDGLICLPLSPVICLPLSPSLDASLGGRIHLSPFVSLCLSPVVSQPGCPSGWTDSFVSRCLPAWMWHSRSAVSFTSRGSVLLAGSGLPSASALASVIPCLVDVGDRVLCLPFIWTSTLLGLVVGRLPCLSLATPCLFVQCLVISCGLSLSLLAFGVPS